MNVGFSSVAEKLVLEKLVSNFQICLRHLEPNQVDSSSSLEDNVITNEESNNISRDDCFSQFLQTGLAPINTLSPTDESINVSKMCCEKQLRSSINNRDRLKSMIIFSNMHKFMEIMIIIPNDTSWWSRGKHVQNINNQNTKKYIKRICHCLRCYTHHFHRNTDVFLEKYGDSNMVLNPTSFIKGCVCMLNK